MIQRYSAWKLRKRYFSGLWVKVVKALILTFLPFYLKGRNRIAVSNSFNFFASGGEKIMIFTLMKKTLVHTFKFKRDDRKIVAYSEFL